MRFDYRNRRKGKLTLVGYRRPGGKGVGAIWTALCDCGNEREVVGRQVLAGRILSCGKCPDTLEEKLPKSTRKQMNYTFRRSLSSNLVRINKENCEWQISPQDYRKYLGMECLLCREKMTSRTVGVVRSQPCTSLTPDYASPVCRGCTPVLRGRSLAEYLEEAYTHLEHVGLIPPSPISPTSPEAIPEASS